MLWFGKKKNKDIENESENEPVIEADGEDSATEDEIIDILNEDGSAEDTETAETEEKDESPNDVIKVINSIDELADYVSSKTIGTMQFMRKGNNEAFDLREVYIRVVDNAVNEWGCLAVDSFITHYQSTKDLPEATLVENKVN